MPASRSGEAGAVQRLVALLDALGEGILAGKRDMQFELCIAQMLLGVVLVVEGADLDQPTAMRVNWPGRYGGFEFGGLRRQRSRRGRASSGAWSVLAATGGRVLGRRGRCDRYRGWFGGRGRGGLRGRRRNLEIVCRRRRCDHGRPLLGCCGGRWRL